MDRTETRRPVPWPIIAAPLVALALVLVFPLEAILLAMFIALAVIIADVHKLWHRRRPVDAERRESVDHQFVVSSLAMITAGMVSAFLFPFATARVTFFAVVAVVLVWGAVRWHVRRLGRERARAGARAEHVVEATESESDAWPPPPRPRPRPAAKTGPARRSPARRPAHRTRRGASA